MEFMKEKGTMNDRQKEDKQYAIFYAHKRDY